jgi:hypothetical protein
MRMAAVFSGIGVPGDSVAWVANLFVMISTFTFIQKQNQLLRIFLAILLQYYY